jgi:hypothetical protein
MPKGTSIATSQRWTIASEDALMGPADMSLAVPIKINTNGTPDIKNCGSVIDVDDKATMLLRNLDFSWNPSAWKKTETALWSITPPGIGLHTWKTKRPYRQSDAGKYSATAGYFQ